MIVVGRGGVIFMGEKRKSKKKKSGGKPENGGKKSAENRKKEVCRKPENYIFESRKTGKLENICGKLFFKTAETTFEKLRKTGKY